ncbi:MAG: hypothetical protein PVI75_02265 [Gammaproteobacteria bacterium]|jgi:hypothetical protein
MPNLLFELYNIIAVFISVAIFICLPGLVLQRLLIKAETFLAEDLGLSFVIGAGIFTLYGYVCYFFQLNLITAIWIYAGLLLLLLVVFKFVLKKNFWKVQDKKYNFLFLLLIVVLIFLLRNLVTVWGGDWGSDSWYHLAQIRFLVDSSSIKNIFPFFKTAILQWMYPFSSYYLLFAFISKVTHIDVVSVWIAIRMVFTAIFLSGVLFLFRQIFKDKNKSLIALAIFILPFLYLSMQSGIGGLTVFTNMSYPKVSSFWIFMPIISACIVMYLTEQTDYSAILATIIICIAFQNFHVVNVAFIGLIILSWLCGFILKREYQYIKKTIFFGAVIIIVSLILFYLGDHRIIKSAARLFDFKSTYLSPQYYGAAPFLEHFLSWYIVKASYFFTFGNNAIMSWTIGTFVFIPFAIWFARRNKLASIFLVGFSVIPLVLAYNPYTVTLMVKLGAPFTIRRILFLFPTAYAFAFVGVELYELLCNKYSNLTILKIRRYFFISILILIVAPAYILPSEERALLWGQKNVYLYQLKNAVRKFIPMQSTVISDAYTSCMLNAFKWVTIVTADKHLIQHTTKDYKAKAALLTLFYSNQITPVRRERITDQFSANYIIIDKKLNANVTANGFKMIYQNPRYAILVRNE